MLLGNLLGSARKKYRKISVEGICFDSRKVKKGYIFFAIRGTNQNGNKFINDALKKGASTIVSDKKFQGFKKNTTLRRVEHNFFIFNSNIIGWINSYTWKESKSFKFIIEQYFA